MQRRWRISSKGQLLGYVDAVDAQGRGGCGCRALKLHAFQSRRLLAQEMRHAAG
jgi:hypothetical protein